MPDHCSGNAFAVTAFDQGDPQNNLESLESDIDENLTFTYPGTPTAPKAGQAYVYPNPYKVSAAWDGSGDRERLIWFANLPERCTIKIFTLAGDLVKTMEHNAATYDGSNVERLSTGFGVSRRALPGGEHAWDLISEYDQAIATFDVELVNQDGRVAQRGKKVLLVSKVPLEAVAASRTTPPRDGLS